MRTFLSFGILTACSLTLLACDPSQDQISYPTCSASAQQCLDHVAVADGLSLPIYRNFSLTTANAALTEAVIVVQGSERNANQLFYTLATATDQAGLSASTLVVSPHFECSADSPPAGDIYWQCSGQDWSHGYPDVSGASTSSYAVMDQLVTLLANKTTFPNLARVVITGIGSGGQLSQRYAATNQIDPVPGVTLQYLVAAPSTYAYLDATRPGQGVSCAADGGCSGQFAPYWDAASCSDYDDYSYGLEGRSGYVAVPSVASVQTAYAARNVTYTVGDEDTLANAAGTDLDTSCEANAQGVDRLARAIDFWSEVSTVYQAQHPLVIVPGCMHSHSCLYFSPELRAILFPPAI